MMYDIGRGYHNYGVAYFWALTQTVLEDGTRFMMNLGDGFGSEYHKSDKASEDHIVVNGTIYKLDVTEMKYNPSNPMEKKSLATMESQGFDTKKFPERRCKVDFTPIGALDEGLNALVFAFKLKVVVGHFNGYCELEGGQRFNLNNVYGHVEHAYSRW